MKQKSGALAFILSAVVLFVLSFVPFMNITFGGNRIVTGLLVALALAIINWILLLLVRAIFKKGSPAFIFVITLIVDALALWLTARVVSNFDIPFFPQAIIAGAILALVCTAAGLVKD